MQNSLTLPIYCNLCAPRQIKRAGTLVVAARQKLEYHFGRTTTFWASGQFMRNCPQCMSRFDEEYFFCLNDGVRLIDDEGEQITFVAPAKVRQPCPKCGAGNDADAVFCSKCGCAVGLASIVTEAPRPLVRRAPASPAPLPAFLADADHDPLPEEKSRLISWLLLAAIAILGLFLIAMLIDNG